MSTLVYKISKKKAEFYRAAHYDFASAIFDNDMNESKPLNYAYTKD